MSLRSSVSRPAVARVRTAVPQLSALYLPRPRLSSYLDDTGGGDVILVSAPAGYGKTLLLADWVKQHDRRVAWLTVDRDDNIDRRFWAGVLAALATATEIPSDNPVHMLGLPAVPSRSPEFLGALVDALEAVPGELVMVFDDLHELTHRDPLAGLANLIENRPSGLRLVMATRSDPPVRLGRLRLAGELREVRAPALAFTLDEAATVLAKDDVHVSAAQREVLHAETAGWPAALRLASLSLREEADPAAFLTDLAGNGQAISDYLVGEILSRLPGDVIDVLLAVSVCDAVTAPLAVALAGRDNAADVLADLEQHTSLVVSYGEGRRWFRVHPLLRAHLHADLRRRRPDRIAELHRRALAWYGETRNPVGAMRHATLAEDLGLVRDVVHRHGAVLAATGHHAEVGVALDRLDAAGLLQGDVRLLLVGVLAHMERGQTAAADVLMQQVAACWPAQPDGALRTLRALATARRAWYDPGDTERPDGPEMSSAESELAVVSLLLRANAAMADGRLREADEIARAAAAQAADDGHDYLVARALTTRAMAAGVLGEIARMVDHATAAGRTAPPESWSHTAAEAYCLVMCGYGALLRGRPTEALKSADAFLRVTGQVPTQAHGEINTLRPVLDVVRGAARSDLGDQHGGLEAIRAGRGQLAEGLSLDAPLTAVLAVLEHEATLRLGLPANARAVQEWAQERIGDIGRDDLTYLRAEAAAWQAAADPAAAEAAREILAPLLDGGTPLVRWVTGAAWTLECLLALRTDNRLRAREALRQALAAAEWSGVVRPLVNAPDAVVDLLARELGNLGGADDLAQAVLAGRRSLHPGGPAGPGVAAALTAREIAVLELLPGPLSLGEIAARLDITTNTVKTHLTAIYAKLGVRSRRDAVARGRLLVRTAR